MTLVEESCMLSARKDPDDDTAPKKEVDLGQVSFSNIHLYIYDIRLKIDTKSLTLPYNIIFSRL